MSDAGLERIANRVIADNWRQSAFHHLLVTCERSVRRHLAHGDPTVGRAPELFTLDPALLRKDAL